MWHDLQRRREHGPERRPGDFEQIQTDPPEQPDRDGILQLSDGPVLQGAAGNAGMFAETHAGWMPRLKRNRRNFTPLSTFATEYSSIVIAAEKTDGDRTDLRAGRRCSKYHGGRV